MRLQGMCDFKSWAPDPQALELEEGEIQVWRAHLDCEAMLSRFEATLSSDERVRASRYFFQQDRNGFIATRGVLRELLGRYVSRTPKELEFDYTPQGKPSLRAELLGRRIRFNVSHSHNLALFAFAVGRNLGVDVELVRPDFGGDEIAERYFAPQEVEELRVLPPSMRAEGFFLCWTRKEAYVKARGEGLHIPLDSFHVSLTPGRPEQLHSVDGFRWSLRSLLPDARYVGAVVGEGQGWQLRCWDWKPQNVDDRNSPV
jgi:4'-phosphopantetheinyl transferase